MNLEQTAITLAEQFGTVRDLSSRSLERLFENLGKVAFGGFGTVLVIGLGFLLYTIFTRLILNGSQVAFGVFLFLFVIFASMSLIFVVYNESKKDRAGSQRLKLPGTTLPAPDTGKILTEPSQMPIPSVVEDSTDLLHLEAQTRRF
ncbi:MAG: hypothetical protein PSX80_01110 [bacterium]|nr:hypothetical protein [bacterium]